MPARKRQTNTRRELVSQEILEKAAALFSQKGFANTSLQDVAQSLRISRTALYHYIGSKEDLLDQLVRGLTRETAEHLEQIAADAERDPLARLEAAIRDMSTRIARNPARFRLLAMSEGELPESIGSQHRDAQRRTLRALIAIVRDGMAAGQLRPMDEHVAAFGLLGMCNWVAWWFDPSHRGAPTIEQLADALARMGVAGLQAPEARAPTGAAGAVHAVELLRQDLAYLERALDDVVPPATAGS